MTKKVLHGKKTIHKALNVKVYRYRLHISVITQLLPGIGVI